LPDLTMLAVIQIVSELLLPGEVIDAFNFCCDEIGNDVSVVDVGCYQSYCDFVVQWLQI